MAVSHLRLLGLGLGITFVLLLHETRVKSDCTTNPACAFPTTCANVYGILPVQLPFCTYSCLTAGYATGTCYPAPNCDGGLCLCSGNATLSLNGGDPNLVDSINTDICEALCTVACTSCGDSSTPSYLGHRCYQANATHPANGEPYGTVCQCCPSMDDPACQG